MLFTTLVAVVVYHICSRSEELADHFGYIIHMDKDEFACCFGITLHCQLVSFTTLLKYNVVSCLSSLWFQSSPRNSYNKILQVTPRAVETFEAKHMLCLVALISELYK